MTLVTPGLRNKLQNWKVDTNLESLWDHIPITFLIKRQGNTDTMMKGNSTFVRWKIKDFNKDLFIETLEWNVNNNQWREDDNSNDKQQYISKTLVETMDFATKRLNTKKKCRKNTYWWSSDIALARKECIKKKKGMAQI